MTRQTHQWMGGDADGQWSNHYELLGLPLGCDDTVTVARIANELLTRIQDATQFEYASQLDSIAGAIRQAQACLTDPASKAAYDRQLARPAIVKASPTLDDIPEAIPVATPVGPTSHDELSFETKRKTPAGLRQQRRSRFWFTAGSAVLGMILFAGLAMLGRHFLIVQAQLTVASSANPEAPETSVTTENEKASRAAETRPNSEEDIPRQHTDGTAEATSPLAWPKPPTGRSERQEGPTPRSVIDTVAVEPSSPTAEPPEPLTPEELQTLSNALTSARSALGNQQFQRANNALAAAKTAARHPHHIRLVDELSELTHYTQEYWAGLDDAWSKLSAGNELVVGTSRVNIVDVNQKQITLRVVGSNEHYQRDALPAGLQQAIMYGWLDENAASTYLIQGAYYATKEPVEAEKASAAWQQASRLGGQAELLLPTLNASYDVERLRQLESDP